MAATCREGQVGQRLLLRWAEEQWAGALQRLAPAQAAVEKLKEAAKAAAVKLKDTRFTLEVLRAWCTAALGRSHQAVCSKPVALSREAGHGCSQHRQLGLSLRTAGGRGAVGPHVGRVAVLPEPGHLRRAAGQ